MKIDWHLKNFEFDGAYEGMEEYFEEKLKKVWDHLGHMKDEESSSFKVDVWKEETRAHEEKYFVKVVVSIPGHVLESDIRGITPQECIDLVEEKILSQVKRLRA